MAKVARPLLAAVPLLCLAALPQFHSIARAFSQAASSDARTPVLVELFTSEGCSDCPPADALLRRLASQQPVPDAEVIVLEEHVDYWDSQGWRDPFSSASMTERQSGYADSFGNRQVYTPMMIVDGRTEFVGSRADTASRAIETAGKTAKPAMQLSWSLAGPLEIRVEPLVNATRGDSADVFVAVTESGLHSDVKRGENAGRALDHTGVVRELSRAGSIGKNSSVEASLSAVVHVKPEWKRANLRAVVFVQERRSRRVLAAANIAFSAQ